MKAFLGLLSRIWRQHVVDDCPAELAACQDCRDLHCSQAQWEACERQRAHP
jgi:hypothetical protein